MIDVFVSRPNDLGAEFQAGHDALENLLQTMGLRPRTLGRTDYPARSPLDEVIRLMSLCKGALVLGYPQIQVRDGSIKGINQPGGFWLPTEWNHIEASLAYSIGLPMLIVHHLGIARGMFDRGAASVFLHGTDLTQPHWPLGDAISGALRTWKAELQDAPHLAVGASLEGRRMVPAAPLHPRGGEGKKKPSFKSADLPADLATAVERLLPNFRVPTPGDMIHEWGDRWNPTTGFPLYCRGRFTRDEPRQELAAILLSKDGTKHRVVVLTENGDGVPVLLTVDEDSGLPQSRFVATLPPGSHDVSRAVWKHGGPRTLRTTRDAVVVGGFEAYATAFCWDAASANFAVQPLSA